MSGRGEVVTLTPMQSQDRRQHHRHRTYRVEVKVATPEAWRASYLRDVSDGGLFVRSRQPLPVQTRVVVELSVGDDVVRLPGTVVRVEEKGFGVRFDELDAAQRQAVTSLGSHAAASSAELAEARGVIEAYEESLASLREGEMEAAQRAELAEFERAVVVERMNELQKLLDGLRAENVRLRTGLEASAQRLSRLETERAQAKALEVSQAERLRTDEERLQAMTEARAAQEREWAATQAALKAELGSLRAAASATPEVERLRDEVRELTSELDDERLKTMALQRALERFRAMGGSIPLAAPEPPRPQPSRDQA